MSYCHRLGLLFLALAILYALYGPSLASASLSPGQTTPPAAGHLMPQPQAGCQNSLTVSTTADSGAGSLRQALTDVCSGGTINFAAGLVNQTITLTTTELSITKTVTITNPNAANLKVSGNNARRVFNIQAGAVVTISSLSVISGTVPTYDSGGGIYNSGTLRLNNVTISGNSGSNGGAIFNYYLGVLTINNSIINNNSASYGGGIYNSYGASITINYSTIINNSAYDGGGVFNGGGTVEINNSGLSNNAAGNEGGGLRNQGTVTINNSFFGGNSTISDGGGIYHIGGLVTINNSTFSSNFAGWSAGGIENLATLTVNNSTFSGNSTRYQQGIGALDSAYGTLYLRNSILANSPDRRECSSSTGSTNINNLIEDGSCNPARSGDPNLGPLQNNGGSTPTHALLLPSPALDAGDSATCLSTDQRGVNRPIDGNGDGISGCDIGAFEAPVGPPSPAIRVLGNDILILDGDTTPSATDHTDFGSALVGGGAVTRTFTVSNTGIANLLFTGSPLITITGDITDFTLVTPPTTPVSSGGSTIFRIRFNPTSVGLRSATLTIASNDLDENMYNFNIQGIGSCLPNITVTNNGNDGTGTLRKALSDVCSGGTINFASGLTNQTITLITAELSITKTVTITNSNAPNLKISGNNTHRVFSIEVGTVVTISNLSIISGTLDNNSSGGGILNLGVLTLNNITANGNSAYYGGGIYNGGNLTLNNSTISGNSANQGGGIFNGSDNLALNNVTLSSNAAYIGAGIFNRYGTLYLRNSILAYGLNSPDCENSSMIATNLKNLIEDGSCSPALSGDPGLGPLQNNGGFTPTHALSFLSPAIDVGDAATCLTIDQRGVTRPLDGTGDGTAVCDIGAFEAPTALPTEIAVLGNNTVIADGDTTPSLADHTHFGSVLGGEAITHTFTISNSGGYLLLTGSPLVTITGHTADFRLVVSPTTLINPGGSTSFQVRFEPTSVGSRNATITIANNDSNENPYNFNIQGTGTCLPTITVTTNSDSGAGTLRQALSGVCSGGEISFANALHDQTITLTSAELSIAKTVTITNPNAPDLRISGDNTRRVFNVRPGSVVTINNLSIISGTAIGDSWPEGNGGGILINNGASLTLSNSTLVGNSTTGLSGGAIANINGTLIVSASTIMNNLSAYLGGGIFNQGTLAITNSIINNNSANSGGGGIWSEGAITLISSTLNNNSTSGGGGAIFNASTLMVDKSIFSYNSAGSVGGGIANSLGGTLIANNSTFSNNVSSYEGGGIFVNNNLTLNNSTVVNNSALYGGGISNYGGSNINNSTFSDNSASNAGGAIFNYYLGLNLRNSILANSLSGGDCHIAYGSITTNQNTLIEDGSCNPALSGDPLLGPLADNGGSTLTHALLPGSPAIDAGDNATCLATDQRGVSRPVDGNGDNFAVCDIGAYEAPRPATPTVQFTRAVYTTTENIGVSQNIVLTRTGSLTNSSQVQVSLGGGTATAGTDYSSAGFPQTITFDSGVISQTVPITLTDDLIVEPTESISLTLSPLVNAVIGAQSSAVLQIQDNDVAPAPEAKVYLPVVLK